MKNKKKKEEIFPSAVEDARAADLYVPLPQALSYSAETSERTLLRSGLAFVPGWNDAAMTLSWHALDAAGPVQTAAGEAEGRIWSVRGMWRQ